MLLIKVWKRELHDNGNDAGPYDTAERDTHRVPKSAEEAPALLGGSLSRGKRESSADSSANPEPGPRPKPQPEAEADSQFSNILSSTSVLSPRPSPISFRPNNAAFQNVLSAPQAHVVDRFHGDVLGHTFDQNHQLGPHGPRGPLGQLGVVGDLNVGVDGFGGKGILGGTVLPGPALGRPLLDPTLGHHNLIGQQELTDLGGLFEPHEQTKRTFDLERLVSLLGDRLGHLGVQGHAGHHVPHSPHHQTLLHHSVAHQNAKPHGGHQHGSPGVPLHGALGGPLHGPPSSGFRFPEGKNTAKDLMVNILASDPQLLAALAEVNQADRPAAVGSPVLGDSLTASDTIHHGAIVVSPAPSILGSAVSPAPSILGSAVSPVPSILGSAVSPAPSILGSAVSPAPSILGSPLGGASLHNQLPLSVGQLVSLHGQTSEHSVHGHKALQGYTQYLKKGGQHASEDPQHKNDHHDLHVEHFQGQSYPPQPLVSHFNKASKDNYGIYDTGHVSDHHAYHKPKHTGHADSYHHVPEQRKEFYPHHHDDHNEYDNVETSDYLPLHPQDRHYTSEPTVTHHTVPGPPGCTSIATRTCHKVGRRLFEIL